jgi:hypothetical protein
VKVLLIANNPNAIPVEGDFDLYVHFNHAFHWGKVPKEKSIVCSRERKQVKEKNSFLWTATSDGDFYKIPARDEQIWAIGWKGPVEKIDATRKRIPLEGVPYPKGGSPTSGYAALHYFLNQGDEVYLSGFNLKVASYYHSTKIHRPDFELLETDKMLEAGIIFRQ